MIQSHSATRPRSSSKLPGVTSDFAASVKNPTGFCLAALSMPAMRGGIAVRLVGQDDVEQVHRESGVGEMGRDARAHGSGSEHGDTAKWRHQS